MAIVKLENLRLDGIPCQAEVDTWPAEPQTWWEPGCPAGWELYRVLDRKGYHAPWLERKLQDPTIEQRFNQAIDEALERLADNEPDDGDLAYDRWREDGIGRPW